MKLNEKKLVYWCDKCKSPVIKSENSHFLFCPICGSRVKYLSTDIRPVFPEERLLFEILTGAKPHTYISDSVWCQNTSYFINGKKYLLRNEIWRSINIEEVKAAFYKYDKDNSYEHFNIYINHFIELNKEHLNSLKYEAINFIRETCNKYSKFPKYIAFSGGKDSTVTADLVIKALGDPSILHLHCDTTLEYSFTDEYIKRMRKTYPKMIFKTIRNQEHNFYDVCDDIGIPTQHKRWCCTIFKTGITSKFFNEFYRGQFVLTFTGLRRLESNTRKNYLRIDETKKIKNQYNVCPIINWMDIDVWLYILGEKLDFNKAYRLGFSRVGCFCCPNMSLRSDYLARIFMPERTEPWYQYLIKYADNLGKENPENYIYSGKWKISVGGIGLAASKDIEINQQTCTTDEYAKTYTLNKPINNEFYNLFVPFGDVCTNLGRKVLNETLIIRNGNPIISIQPKQDNNIKIKTLNVKDHNSLHKKIAAQILKFNACRKCYRCEGACKKGAITIRHGQYFIDPKICTHCTACTQTKVIPNGCIMKSYLR